MIATMRHYRELTGRRLDLHRVLAWHLHGALGDVLWRREADDISTHVVTEFHAQPGRGADVEQLSPAGSAPPSPPSP